MMQDDTDKNVAEALGMDVAGNAEEGKSKFIATYQGRRLIEDKIYHIWQARESGQSWRFSGKNIAPSHIGQTWELTETPAGNSVFIKGDRRPEFLHDSGSIFIAEWQIKDKTSMTIFEMLKRSRSKTNHTEALEQVMAPLQLIIRECRTSLERSAVVASVIDALYRS